MPRIHRILFALSLFLAPLLAWSQGLRICDSCGHEDLKGVETCENCGAKLPPLPPKPGEEKPAEEPPAIGAAPGAVEEARRDVAQARKLRKEHPETALVLFENALALLSAESGTNFQSRAAKAVAAEIDSCRKDFYKVGARNVDATRMALLQGERDAALYFKSAGRIPFGRAWIPPAWREALAPSQLAAIRHAHPPFCPKCDGIGHEPCRKCAGRGRVPCKECKNGWVFRQTSNNLKGTDGLKIRERCPKCNGSSLVSCDACLGHGAAICKACDGSGKAPLCRTCNGSGLVPCKTCARNSSSSRRNAGGDAPCPDCRDTRETLCPKCGGDGRTTK